MPTPSGLCNTLSLNPSQQRGSDEGMERNSLGTRFSLEPFPNARRKPHRTHDSGPHLCPNSRAAPTHLEGNSFGVDAFRIRIASRFHAREIDFRYLLQGGARWTLMNKLPTRCLDPPRKWISTRLAVLGKVDLREFSE